MPLYSADELQSLLPGCEVLEIAGSNVTASQWSPSLDELSKDAEAWATTIEVERALNNVPGLLDSGSHIIMAARRKI